MINLSLFSWSEEFKGLLKLYRLLLLPLVAYQSLKVRYYLGIHLQNSDTEHGLIKTNILLSFLSEVQLSQYLLVQCKSTRENINHYHIATQHIYHKIFSLARYCQGCNSGTCILGNQQPPNCIDSLLNTWELTPVPVNLAKYSRKY